MTHLFGKVIIMQQCMTGSTSVNINNVFLLLTFKEYQRPCVLDTRQTLNLNQRIDWQEMSSQNCHQRKHSVHGSRTRLPVMSSHTRY